MSKFGDLSKIEVTGYSGRFSPVSGIEEMILPEHLAGKPTSKKKEKELATLMHKANPDELGGVQVRVNSYSPRDAFKRMWHNPRTSFLGKTLGLLTHGPDALMAGPEDTVISPAYDPLSDVVYAPWRSDAASMHELGHAIDFNKGKVPQSWLGRQAKGLVRDLYTTVPGFTLHQEHAAWRKGIDSYLRGSALKDVDWSKVKEHMTDVQHTKYPALGTYWGGSIGGALGVAGTIASLIALSGNSDTKSQLLRRLSFLLPAVGGVTGALSGVGVGKLLATRAKSRVDDDYKGQYDRLRAEQKQPATKAAFLHSCVNLGKEATMQPLIGDKLLFYKEAARVGWGSRMKSFFNMADDMAKPSPVAAPVAAASKVMPPSSPLPPTGRAMPSAAPGPLPTPAAAASPFKPSGGGAPATPPGLASAGSNAVLPPSVQPSRARQVWDGVKNYGGAGLRAGVNGLSGGVAGYQQDSALGGSGWTGGLMGALGGGMVGSKKWRHSNAGRSAVGQGFNRSMSGLMSGTQTGGSVGLLAGGIDAARNGQGLGDSLDRIAKGFDEYSTQGGRIGAGVGLASRIPGIGRRRMPGGQELSTSLGNTVTTAGHNAPTWLGKNVLNPINRLMDTGSNDFAALNGVGRLFRKAPAAGEPALASLPWSRRLGMAASLPSFAQTAGGALGGGAMLASNVMGGETPQPGAQGAPLAANTPGAQPAAAGGGAPAQPKAPAKPGFFDNLLKPSDDQMLDAISGKVEGGLTPQQREMLKNTINDPAKMKQMMGMIDKQPMLQKFQDGDFLGGVGDWWGGLTPEKKWQYGLGIGGLGLGAAGMMTGNTGMGLLGGVGGAIPLMMALGIIPPLAQWGGALGLGGGAGAGAAPGAAGAPKTPAAPAANAQASIPGPMSMPQSQVPTSAYQIPEMPENIGPVARNEYQHQVRPQIA